MSHFKLNRLELAGSLGDLGTLLPIAMGMILINGLNPAGLFFTIGLFYIISGAYFRITVPVQPMKVIGAYSIAANIDSSIIFASGLLMAALLLFLGLTGGINLISRYTPKPVVRGVQLSTGIMLIVQGIKFMLGTSSYQMMKQAVEPYLSVQNIGPVPVGLVFGIAGGLLTIFFLENKKYPAGLLVISLGLAFGLIFGTRFDLSMLIPGFHFPEILPQGLPSLSAFSLALIMLVLPQTPMTIGNAVIAYCDLSRDYFGHQSIKVTYKSACVSMALANGLSFLFGGMPLCHGAGGLAAHHRFGARTAGSNLMIGSIFVILVLLFGSDILSMLYLLPMSVLGILLVFAGSELALSIIDLNNRKDLLIPLMMVGTTLASNLAAAFIAGLAIAWILSWHKIKV